VPQHRIFRSSAPHKGPWRYPCRHSTQKEPFHYNYTFRLSAYRYGRSEKFRNASSSDAGYETILPSAKRKLIILES